MKNKKLVMTISSVLATVVLATGCAQKTEEKKEWVLYGIKMLLK